MTKVNINSQTQNTGLAGLCYVYAKNKWMRQFKAFDLDGFFVANLIFCSMIADNEENRRKLQEVADEYAGAEWQFQLRNPQTKGILYTTSLAA